MGHRFRVTFHTAHCGSDMPRAQKQERGMRAARTLPEARKRRAHSVTADTEISLINSSLSTHAGAQAAAPMSPQAPHQPCSLIRLYNANTTTSPPHTWEKMPPPHSRSTCYSQQRLARSHLHNRLDNKNVYGQLCHLRCWSLLQRLQHAACRQRRRGCPSSGQQLQKFQLIPVVRTWSWPQCTHCDAAQRCQSVQ